MYAPEFPLHPSRMPSRQAPRRLSQNINDLPVEILEQIFIACVIRPGIGPNSNHAPLLMLGVCKHWNIIALSLPVLWAEIAPGFTTASRTKLWIDRSRNHPLTINLQLYLSNFASATKHNLEETFDLFVDEAHRWGDVSFELNNGLAKKFILGAARTTRHFTSLKLSVDHCNGKNIRRIINALDSCIYLRHLEWKRPGILGPFVTLPLTRLVTIVIRSSFAIEQGLCFLSQCTSAVEISLYRIKNEHNLVYGWVPKSTTLPLLQSLTLHTRTDPTDILRRFILPSLQTLDLTSEGPGLSFDTEFFRKFLEFSQCTLARLRIQVMELSDSTAIDILKILPVQSTTDIEILYKSPSRQVTDTLRRDGVPARFVDLLKVRTKSSGLVPGVLVKPMPKRSMYDF